MSRKIIYILAAFVCLLISCTTKKDEQHKPEKPAIIAFAKGFSIGYTDDYTIVKVRNPWDTTRTLQTYILIDKDKPRPGKLPEGVIVGIPVGSIACLYSIDASMIEMLGDINKVKAMAETRYVKLPALRKGIDEGRIADIGESTALNTERLMDVSPDVIFVSPFQNAGYGKLETTGIAILENAAYMENSPLGRAEWIRFIAAFLKKDKEAEAIMDGIAARYTALAEKTQQAANRPTVLSEKKYGQAWYIPGGNSYMAHFYKDAGANYCWMDDTSTGSLDLSFESVYEKAEKANYWIIKTDQSLTYESLKKEFEPYTFFKAWKDRKIIVCNSVQTNYYEEGTMNPDRVLADLIHIFHPELLPDHTNQYFKLLNEE